MWSLFYRSKLFNHLNVKWFIKNWQMIWSWSLEAQNSQGGTVLRLHPLCQIELTHELRFCKFHLNCLGFNLLPEMAIKFRNLLRILHWFLSWFSYCYLLISLICGCMSCWTPWVFSLKSVKLLVLHFRIFSSLWFLSCPELSKLRI